MKIALCQINTVAGNIERNTRMIVEALDEASRSGATLAVFPEMTITGYPPRDLLEYGSFVDEAHASLSRLQEASRRTGVDCIVGAIHANVFGGKKELLNSAAIIRAGGEIRFVFKKLLPTYDVFDEHRYFHPCPSDCVSPLIEYEGGLRVGVSICEDIWNDHEFWKDERQYEYDPIQSLVLSGANLIVNISASPFVATKPGRRVAMLQHTARRWDMPVLLLNQVGGCDQIVFDGGSGVFLPDGSVPCVSGWFTECVSIWDTGTSGTSPAFEAMLERIDDEVASIHDALLLGLRDYLRKTGFAQVIVGNSGGIDSATVITLAVRALGPENVISVSMPGPYTSESTRSDSAEISRRLGIRHLEIPIGGVFEAFGDLLHEGLDSAFALLFAGDASKISKLANENIQARIRGNILMWLSNAITDKRTLVLSTGNKSEVAAGYCTLYGDMAGGLALISDVPKMMVYRLARFLNSDMGDPIPKSVLDREPTAELAPNQKDADSLPPYPVLDEIVRLYVEERQGRDEIVEATGFEGDLVGRVIRMIDTAEYKRAQAPPGLKVTSKAFGLGRRMPIARG